MKKCFIVCLAAILSFSWADESLAAISCVFSNGGKTVTITGGGNDILLYGGCPSSNSISTDDWTYSDDWKSNVEDITIGTGITQMGGDNSFRNAKNLKSVTILNGLTNISDNAFNGASNLTNIVLPDTLKYIGNNAFYGASSLTNITLPNSLKSIGVQAFSGASSLESITIPEGVTTIGIGTFSQATALKSVTIPDSVTSIGDRAFHGTTALTSINLPKGLLTIGSSAFSESGLTSIAIPDSVTKIGDTAFFKCNNLTEIIIPDTLTAENVASWSYQAFSGAFGVRKIRCVASEGNDSANDMACITALERFLIDENGHCKVYTCFNNNYFEKIGNTCFGFYFGSVSGDGTCVHKSSCNNGGNYTNADTRQCVTPESCTGMYVADPANKKCFKMPGCVNYADGACQACGNDYLKQSGACVEKSACTGRSYVSGDECKTMPTGCASMSGDSCATCENGYLGKEGGCIDSALGCGAGYTNIGGFCKRRIYTIDEANAVAGPINRVSIKYR